MEVRFFEGVEQQTRDIVIIRVDEWLANNFIEGQIREFLLGCNPLSFGASCQSRQLVAGLLLIGFREELAEIGERETLDHGDRRWIYGMIHGTEELAVGSVALLRERRKFLGCGKKSHPNLAKARG